MEVYKKDIGMLLLNSSKDLLQVLQKEEIEYINKLKEIKISDISAYDGMITLLKEKFYNTKNEKILKFFFKDKDFLGFLEKYNYQKIFYPEGLN
jgi:hypothetical protein